MSNRTTLIILLVCLSLVGCSNTGYVPMPTTTQTPDPAQVFVNANSSQATAIAAAATAQFYSGQLTATVEAQHATATERAWLLQATQQAAEIVVIVAGDESTQIVKAFGNYTVDLQNIGSWLKEHNVKTVAMESTGVYWIPLFEELERQGFACLLISSRSLRRVPGWMSSCSR